MADTSHAVLRDQLQEERSRVREQLARLGHGDDADLDFDENFADSGQVTAERGEVEALSGQLSETLSDIEDALAKFDHGTYGECESLPPAHPRGAPGGHAGGAPLHRVRLAAPLSDAARASVHLDEQTVICFGCLVVAVILHEISHGVVALWFGDRTAKEAGRLTLNPIPHIDPFGSIVLPALGAITGLPVLAWAKPVPVNPSRLRHPRRDMVFVSLAGPATNLTLMVDAGGRRQGRVRERRAGPLLRPAAARHPDPVLVRSGEPAARVCSTCCPSRLSTARRCSSGSSRPPGSRSGTSSGPTGSWCCSCSCSRPA